MALRELQRSEWNRYFHDLTRVLRRCEGELDRLETGETAAADVVPVDQLAYDPREDALELVTGAYGHMIAHPRRIFVDESMDRVHRIEVVDGAGKRQVIGLKAARHDVPS